MNERPKSRVLVLGITGMLGHAVYRSLTDKSDLTVFGSTRYSSYPLYFEPRFHPRIHTGINVLDHDTLTSILAATNPDVVVNCIGIVKQLAASRDPLIAVPINTLLPHRLAKLCRLNNAKLIHISTDCVFSGRKGLYLESDHPDSTDLYGTSKFLGELANHNTITLRTSIIGHELSSSHSLIDWFLSQKGAINGYTRAIFSGLPTNELAEIIYRLIKEHGSLNGLFHVASAPISKYALLSIVAKVYGKEIEIIKDESVVIDRSLNGDLLRRSTGIEVGGWESLVKSMHTFQRKYMIEPR